MRNKKIEPVTQQEMRVWLTRRQLLEIIGRLWPCRCGHSDCSNRMNGPCYVQVLDRYERLARTRASQVAGSGAGRAQVWATIQKDYPALELVTMESIVEEAVNYKH